MGPLELIPDRTRVEQVTITDNDGVRTVFSSCWVSVDLGARTATVWETLSATLPLAVGVLSQMEIVWAPFSRRSHEPPPW